MAEYEVTGTSADGATIISPDKPIREHFLIIEKAINDYFKQESKFMKEAIEEKIESSLSRELSHLTYFGLQNLLGSPEKIDFRGSDDSKDTFFNFKKYNPERNLLLEPLINLNINNGNLIVGLSFSAYFSYQEITKDLFKIISTFYPEYNVGFFENKMRVTPVTAAPLVLENLGKSVRLIEDFKKKGKSVEINYSGSEEIIKRGRELYRLKLTEILGIKE